MRRTATEILRRGFENMLANWPLLAIRIAESAVLVVIAIGAALAVIVPILVTIGFDLARWSSQPAVDTLEQLSDLLAMHWVLIVYVFVIITIILIAFVGVHSFVIAGCVRVYVDAERKNGGVALPPRDAFRAFTTERWLEGAKRGWWTVFWIYNIAWAVAGALILLPVTLLFAVVLLLRENPGPAIAIGCGGLILTILLMIIVGVITNVWTQKGIVDCVARGTAANDSLRSAWNEIKSDTGRHLAIAVVMIVVALAGSAVFSTFSMMGSFDHNAGLNLMLMPMQFAASIANGIFSAAVGAWFLASFAALAVESRP